MAAAENDNQNNHQQWRQQPQQHMRRARLKMAYRSSIGSMANSKA